MDRRRFLKYAGATAAVVGASALGHDYFLNHEPPTNQPLTTQQTSAGRHKPPAIKNLQWTPTRVVNSKVYEGAVSFEAEDATSVIVNAQLQFDPVFPSEIPTDVIPQESSRSYDYMANSMAATFSQPISDLKGGKSYRARVKVKDQYGSEGESALDIPYLRELENLSGKSKSMVGVQYGTWREGPGTWPPDKPADPNSPYSGWKYLAHPLLGEYDSSDEFVIAKHLDWLSGYGVGLLLSFVDSGLTYRNTELLLKNPLASDCKIAVTYDLTSMLPEVPPPFPGGWIDLSSKRNLDTLYRDFYSMAVDFFAQPNYFRIDDRPLVFLFGASDLKGDIPLTLSGLKKQLMQSYGVNPFLIGDTVGFFDPERDYVKPYDAVSRFSPYSQQQDVCCSNFEQKLDELYSRWSSFARRNGVAFVPTATPGFVATRPTQKDWPVLSKSPERFSRQIEVAKKYVDRAVPILLVSTFNDLAENTTVEPTKEEDFQYLQTLRDALSKA